MRKQPRHSKSQVAIVKIMTVLASIRRGYWKFVNSFRFVTPHYWMLRRHRCEVARVTQTLLPPPYDPYAIELRSRSINYATVADGVCDDDMWNPTMEKLSAKAMERRLGVVGGVEIAAWTFEDAHSTFAAIDHDFIAGVANRSGEAIGSFSDLSHRLAPETVAERLKAALFGVTPGEINNLSGHVGEATVLRHLHEAGIDAQLAPVSNQPGWDLSWDGHLVNVKTWSDVGDLSSHFERYPDIAALVPGDAAGVPADALHFDPVTGTGLDSAHDALATGSHGVVVVDDALSGGAIHDHVQQAETFVSGGHQTVHGHLPYITMALSGIREFDLLIQGKTDLTAATKNAALDVAGTGVGGVLGAKVGAVVGTLILPGFGTAVGGILGGFFGAKKGREFTSDIKQEPFKEAAAAYESALVEFQRQATAREAEATALLNSERTPLERRLKGIAREARKCVQETRQTLESWVVYDSYIQPDEAKALLERSSNEVTSLRVAVRVQYQLAPWWRKVLWPDIMTLALQQALALLKRVQRELNGLQRTSRKGKAISRGQLMALLASVGVMQEQMVDSLAQIYAAQQERDRQARRLVSDALVQTLRERREIEKKLSEKFEAVRAAIQEALRPALMELNKRIERARIEGAKLGLNL